jgi:hypothetical protein
MKFFIHSNYGMDELGRGNHEGSYLLHLNRQARGCAHGKSNEPEIYTNDVICFSLLLHSNI